MKRFTAAALFASAAVSAFAGPDEHLPVKRTHALPDSIAVPSDSLAVSLGALEIEAAPDSILIPSKKWDYDVWEERETAFNPDPTRAVWMAALFPGLGQLYNRRYWKLPIVIGGYMGLAYATSWNNSMLNDYTLAYRDIMDNDPSTNSYMNLFPPTTQESDLDKTWLTSVLQSRKNFYRRNRDLCIIAMVGVYLIAMVDAYVDASLSHFDISPELSMDWAPVVIPPTPTSTTSIGVSWAFNF